jgi:hypothetical protein
MPFETVGKVWEDPDIIRIEKGRARGGSLLAILFCSAVSAVSLVMVAILLRAGNYDLVTLLAYGIYPFFCIPVVIWELLQVMPASLELHPHEVRYLVRGRLKTELVLDAEVEADVSLSSEPMGPRVKAFDKCCDESLVGEGPPAFLTITGIQFVRGGTVISISHDDGWTLADMAELWDVLKERLVKHKVAMGGELIRYIQFRKTLGTVEVEDTLDMFAKIRRIDPEGSVD